MAFQALDKLSVNSPSIPNVKKLIRSISYEGTTQLAKKAILFGRFSIVIESINNFIGVVVNKCDVMRDSLEKYKCNLLFRSFEMERIKLQCNRCATCYLAKCGRFRPQRSRCHSICPFLSSANLTPRQIAYKLSEFDPEDEETIKLIYSCMQCGFCEQACPKCLKPNEMFLRCREALASLGKGPMKFHRFMYTHKEWNFFSVYREEYGGLRQPLLEGSYKYIFFPGCGLWTYTPWLVEKVYKILSSKLEGVGLLLNCCYLPLETIGLKEKFAENFALLKEKLDELGSPAIITACPNCFRQFKRHLDGYRIHSAYEVLKDHRFKLSFSGKIAIHDSCPFRYYSDQLNVIREIFRSNGVHPIELDYNKDLTLCCGAGGGVPYANPDLSAKVSEIRVSDAKRKGADVLVAYCVHCLIHFLPASQKFGIKLLHILDLITGCESNYLDIHRKIQNLFTEPKWSYMLSKFALSETV